MPKSAVSIGITISNIVNNSGVLIFCISRARLSIVFNSPLYEHLNYNPIKLYYSKVRAAFLVFISIFMFCESKSKAFI